MKLKYSFIVVLITASLVSCSNRDEKAVQQNNISVTDSAENEKQRIIDSVDLVTREQQIIADSIQKHISD